MMFQVFLHFDNDIISYLTLLTVPSFNASVLCECDTIVLIFNKL